MIAAVSCCGVEGRVSQCPRPQAQRRRQVAPCPEAREHDDPARLAQRVPHPAGGAAVRFRLNEQHIRGIAMAHHRHTHGGSRPLDHLCHPACEHVGFHRASSQVWVWPGAVRSINLPVASTADRPPVRCQRTQPCFASGAREEVYVASLRAHPRQHRPAAGGHFVTHGALVLEPPAPDARVGAAKGRRLRGIRRAPCEPTQPCAAVCADRQRRSAARRVHPPFLQQPHRRHHQAPIGGGSASATGAAFRRHAESIGQNPYGLE